MEQHTNTSAAIPTSPEGEERRRLIAEYAALARLTPGQEQTLLIYIKRLAKRSRRDQRR